jgi:acyl-CoA dehydrogenase
MAELMPEIRDICDTIKRRVDRAYVAQCGQHKKRPDKLWRLWADTGLLGVGLPQEYGGVGGNLSEVTLAHDLLFQAGLVMGSTITNHMVRIPILRYGSEEQKQRYLPATATGAEFFAFAITEPDAGSNTFKVRTSAKRISSGEYLLSGQKMYITGFVEASNALVVARTSPADPASRSSGLTLFFVDTKSKGISATPMNIGMHFPDIHYIVNFDEVVVPADNILGGEGRGIEALFDCLNPERILTAAISVGMADHVIYRAAEYAKVRAPFGAPIGSYQSVQHPLATSKMRVDASRAMLYPTAARFDEGADVGLESSMVKWLAAEAFKQATDIGMTTFGGSAFDLSQDILPFYLNAKLYEVAPINNNILLSYIAQKALGLPKSY